MTDHDPTKWDHDGIKGDLLCEPAEDFAPPVEPPNDNEEEEDDDDDWLDEDDDDEDDDDDDDDDIEALDPDNNRNNT